MPRCCPNVNLHINDYSLWCSNLQLCIEREQTTERSMRGPEICRIAITFHSDAFMSVTLQSKSSVEWRKRNEKCEKDFSSGERRSGFCAADDDGLLSPWVSRRCSSLENWIEIPYLWVWQKERLRIRQVKNFMNYSIKNWYFSTSLASRHHWQKVEFSLWKGLPRRLPQWILNPHFIRNGNCRAIRVNVVHWDWRSSDNDTGSERSWAVASN